jgi:hypothetical protein
MARMRSLIGNFPQWAMIGESFRIEIQETIRTDQG